MKNRIIPIIIFASTFLFVNANAGSYTSSNFKLNLQQETDSVKVVLSSVYTTNIKQLELSGLAIKKASGKAKNMAESLRDYFIKSNLKLRDFAKQKKITLPMTKPQGGMRPDGRIDSAPENLKDTSRNESDTGEAGNTGKKMQPNIEPDITQSLSNFSKLKGTDFNKAYLNLVASDLSQLTSLYGTLSGSNDAALSAFANNEIKQLTHFSARLK
ncbi:hypothetical protein [Pedobacter sp. Leaf176]|uniref:hypothetical protein n=1 Tax=Pedobacter sp. Leaf176 TaxID=1736286 RepID=UPI0006FAC548|nr:hypothetical protein [Pedobacter sp. Leaf176]KQR67285.1 hypothetical protein ASF92_16395 [Pedobacter sp. Leaf176]